MPREFFLGIVWGMIFITMLSSVAFAQLETNYQPANFIDTIPPAIQAELKAKLALRKKTIQASRNVERNFISSLLDKQNEALVDYYNKDYFIEDDELTNTLRRVQDKIYTANPDLAREVRVYAFRSPSPNAFTFWDGTVGVTLGLYSRMENEDELAFVLCHEMAHHYLNHLESRIREIAHANYDPNLEKELREVKSNRYGQYTQLKKIMRDLGLSMNQHSRGREYEADSLGLTFLLRTTYNPLAAARIMEILDAIDHEKYTQPLDLQKYLAFDAYPFRKEWLPYSFSPMQHRVGDEEYGNSDTVKTHPDCMKRKQVILKRLGQPQADLKQLPTDPTIVQLANRSDFEIVEGENHFRHFGRSFYMNIALLDRFPKNVYLRAMVGQNLYGIYLAQKNHRLGKDGVALPDKRLEKNYNDVLGFLHNLRLTELSSLCYYYVFTQAEAYADDSEFMFAMWQASHLPLSKFSPNLIRDDYQARYPQGRHLPEMK